jgi:hypothetical protein
VITLGESAVNASHPQALEREGDEQRASRDDGRRRRERCAQHGHVRHDDDEDRDDHSEGAEVTLPMHGLLSLAGERVVQVHQADRPDDTGVRLAGCRAASRGAMR